MARRLKDANFGVNVVPYGYKISLSPLKIAVGARQVEIVRLLILQGAKPIEPDSWATLAGLVMNRSWSTKTLSEADRDSTPGRMMQILEMLLKAGWNLNEPYETSGMTVPHQAVTFYTGDSYLWDLSLRKAITEFMCRHGADPFQKNAEGKTAYDLALTSGHQDLLTILARDSKDTRRDDGLAGLVELSG
jgi:ankyrin repeat protein